ncbi:MAG: clan AA aspartic protease [Chloroflexi bacterium]|nr:clan AA aspartic protease [Chloroflexota bacterium]
MVERGVVREFGEQLQGTCIVYPIGDNGVPARVEAVVDTGFAGYLTLRQNIINELGLTQISSIRAFFADGRSAECSVYLLRLEWQGELRTVEVASLEGHPLIGMALLRGSELRMMVEDEGVIEITPFDQL